MDVHGGLIVGGVGKDLALGHRNGGIPFDDLGEYSALSLNS
jgi:hypothetical protein